MTTVRDPRELLTALLAPASRADPYPLFHALREASPATVGARAVIVGRYAHCAALLRDPRVSSDPARAPAASDAEGAAAREMLTFMARDDRSFVVRDPPDHTRLRRLVSKAFTPRAIAALRPRIQQLVADLLDDAARHDQFDVVHDFGFPLATAVIGDLLGIPAEYHERFRDWARPIFGADLLAAYLGLTPDRAGNRASSESLRQFRGYLKDLVAEKRHTSSEGDLLGRLAAVEESGDRLTEQELVSTAMLLFTAGHGTTVRLIGNAVLALLRHPDQLAALRDDPGLVPRAVEEALRFEPPTQYLSYRTALEALSVGGHRVPAGSFVMLLLAAANRDPEVFPDPDRFDITRAEAGQHLSFGGGPHFCVGAGLARLEATVALAAFAERVTGPRLAGPGPRYQPNAGTRGLAALPVTFRAIRA